MRTRILLGMSVAVLLTAASMAQSPRRSGRRGWHRPAAEAKDQWERRHKAWGDWFRAWREAHEKMAVPKRREAERRSTRYGGRRERSKSHTAAPGRWGDRLRAWREAHEKMAAPKRTESRRHSLRRPQHREQAKAAGKTKDSGASTALLKELKGLRAEIKALRAEVEGMKKAGAAPRSPYRRFPGRRP